MNLQNLVDWAEFKGIDLFSGVTVPEPLNAETVKSAIMIRSGLMTPLYLEPEVFQACVKHWFTAKQWSIRQLIKVIESDYNPIENYNRTERSSETLSGSDSLSMTGGSKSTNSGKDTTAHSGKDTTAHSGTDTEAHSGTDTTTNEISAENVSTYSPDSQSNTQHGESIGTTYGEQIDLTHGEQIDLTHGHTVTDEYQNRKDITDYGKISTKESSISGNIGVTTTQQMIEQELELLRHFDIYGWIADQFENDNMLLIY